ncbi:MAG: TetR/AcrR family transcriptional regulator [Ruminococcus sp.]|jgi:AcrR family transcriptional regulator
MDNRETILTCALDLFYARGYDGVGVQEIADAAGITKPTLYYYFGSKKGLLCQVLHTYYSKLDEMLSKAVSFRGRIPERLFQIAKAYFAYASRYRKCYLLMLSLFYSGRESEGFQTVFPLIQEYYNRIVQVFQDSACELGNMRGRQQQFAVGFIGALDHYLMMRLRDGSEDKAVEISDEQTYGIVHQFMYGIYS